MSDLWRAAANIDPMPPIETGAAGRIARGAERLEVDLCVIGAGTGGLVTAAAAAQLGARTALFERHKMGGDCLNYGCVPSKALLAAAKAAQTVRTAGRFGIETAPPAIDYSAVMRHVHGAIAAIAPHDSVERFEGLGVKVVRGEARFIGPQEVAGGGFIIHARRFVIAAGSSPAVPPTPGLDEVAYLTNETVFENTVLPEHLIVIGGGPIGLEMAQAHRLLGSQVTVLEAAQILSKDDPELVGQLRDRLEADGIVIREGAEIRQAEKSARGIAVMLKQGGGEERIEGTHLLVAAGRRPNVQHLDLDKAGIAYSAKGIEVDGRLRTTNRHVYAAGDIAGGPQFTHVADYHAGVVIRNALFRLPVKVDYRALPWVTYTDPELAQVGMIESEARKAHGEGVRVLRYPFRDVDRAQTDRETEGMIKVVTRGNGRILGASILGAHAGELIHPWELAIARGLKVSALATMIAPYPTFGEISKKAARSYYAPKLFGAWPRRLVRLLAALG
jgi:pyruvate/2-oxoglutarate dehydrogenase complex dihydrolipoamide dehydrogenase (E3) component